METEAPTTPPAVVPELIHLPDSTPHSRGTAAHAQSLVDERYRVPHTMAKEALLIIWL